MKINLLAFGRAREIIGHRHLTLEVDSSMSASVLRAHLCKVYPLLENMGEFALALNQEYLNTESIINLSVDDEVAIIPPVCGG